MRHAAMRFMLGFSSRAKSLLAAGYWLLAIGASISPLTVDREPCVRNFVCHAMRQAVNGKRITVNGFKRHAHSSKALFTLYSMFVNHFGHKSPRPKARLLLMAAFGRIIYNHRRKAIPGTHISYLISHICQHHAEHALCTIHYALCTFYSFSSDSGHRIHATTRPFSFPNVNAPLSSISVSVVTI